MSLSTNILCKRASLLIVGCPDEVTRSHESLSIAKLWSSISSLRMCVHFYCGRFFVALNEASSTSFRCNWNRHRIWFVSFSAPFSAVLMSSVSFCTSNCSLATSLILGYMIARWVKWPLPPCREESTFCPFCSRQMWTRVSRPWVWLRFCKLR